MASPDSSAASRRHPERAEPRSIGTSGTANILGREVRLLGALLGEIILEQAGPVVYDLVESTRQRAVAARRRNPADRVTFDVQPYDADTLTGVVRAFGLYFQLVNLAEARAHLRRAARRARSTAGASESERLRTALRRPGVRDVLTRIRVHPVLTAHPTEARRRTLLVALRRIARLLEQADDPRLTPAQDRDLRRQLREEIALLWRTAELRRGRPTPIDEVRTAMVVFDETLYRLTPRLYGRVDMFLPGPRSARARELAEPAVPAFLRYGSWIGADRDGHPAVTADVTEQAIRIQADHVLRGHEAVANRLAQALAAKVRSGAVPAALVHRLAGDELAMPDVARSLLQRFPDEPFRQRLGFIAERLRHTRVRLLGERRGATTGGYASPAELLEELRELQGALVEVGLARSAWGDVHDFAWQVQTFGFHLASLEVRQHATVHQQALRGDDPGVPRREEVLETFRAMARIQREFGEAAVARYVVSFTSSASDALAVLDLADAAGVGGALALDVVPLFESSAALSGAGSIVEAMLGDPRYRTHLRSRGDRQEVMLGYSDSTKESGYLAANWLLHNAQADLAAVAARHGIELTLFHGRGGAVGRGGGQLELAVAAQPPGSVDGRLKFTEQGEVIWTRYGDPELGLEHLETLTAATVESLTGPDAGAGDPPGAAQVMAELAGEARRAYRALVYDDAGFAGFFQRMTPIAVITGLQLGSRPARRSSPDATPAIDDLRAIPWVFAWSQARVELPAWYGFGSALEAFRRGRPDADAQLAALYRGWPFLRSIVDNARVALARADMTVARGYASLATEPDDAARWSAIEAEHTRTVEGLERIVSSARQPELGDAGEDDDSANAGPGSSGRSAALRAPYIDTLSVLQLELLRTLRARDAADPADPSARALHELVALTISGLSAALQGTG